MRKALIAMAGVLALGAAAPAWSHGVTKPQHGGVVQLNGETMFELVATPAGVSLYLIDEDDPVNAEAKTATLTVTADGKQVEVAMASKSGNQFFAQGLHLPKGANVGVQVIDKATQARIGATFTVE